MLGVRALAFDHVHERLSQSEKSREQLQAEVHRLKESLQDKEKHCFVLGKRMSSLAERVWELEKALKASSDRMMQMQEVYAAKTEQLVHLHEQELKRLQTSSYNQGRRTGLDQGTSSGIQDCKSHLLMTPYGQAFLDSLVRHLPEAYLHFSNFWLRMVEPLTEWATAAILECCQQLGIPEQAAAINVGPIVRIFEMEPETL